MAFLLTSTPLNNGLTHIEIDDGPARRVNVITLTDTAHLTLQVPADELLAYTLSEVRPPANRRNR